MADMAVNNTKSFEYTYSAKQQQEIENIRKKYIPKEEDKLETLRKLDRGTEKPGSITAIALGILGSLIFGIGMCFTMVWTQILLIQGIVIGLLGMALMGAAYPIYKKITRRKREKIAGQILALSEELSL